MKVFHASSIIVDKPDVLHSRDYLDFGPGFYVTSLLEQAEKYSLRFIRRGKDAYLNTYNLSDDYKKCKVLQFDKYDESWLEYVSACRAGRIPDDSDIVIGGIANDKIFRTLNLYFAGDINKDEALKRLIHERPNQQLCIRNQIVIDKYITFINSKKL